MGQRCNGSKFVEDMVDPIAAMIDLLQALKMIDRVQNQAEIFGAHGFNDLSTFLVELLECRPVDRLRRVGEGNCACGPARAER